MALASSTFQNVSTDSYEEPEIFGLAFKIIYRIRDISALFMLTEALYLPIFPYVWFISMKEA
jgi:hypothetical protein